MKIKALIILLLFISASYASSTIDAAMMINKETVIFFKGREVISFNMATNSHVKTRDIEQALPGIPFTKIDAAVNFGNGKAYFFSGHDYCRFDLNSFQTDPGYPKRTEDYWDGLQYEYISAATNWSEKSFYFSGNMYVKFDNNSNLAFEGYPKNISSETWGGIPFTNFDAVFTYNKRTYFFSGDQYLIYENSQSHMMSGYPKAISSWTSLANSLNKSTVVSTVKMNPENYKNHTIQKQVIDLSPYQMKSPNSVISAHDTYISDDGIIHLVFQQEHDMIILKFNQKYERIGNPIVLNNHWFSDLYILPKGELAVLAGKDVNNTYLEKYPNTLYLIKYSTEGEVVYKTHIFGGEGHGPQKSWFDGGSKAVIACNGSEFGIYFEIQRNFAENSGENIHNGDMFVVTDMSGNIKKEREHFWTASHSSLVKVLASASGDFYTMTIGDANPYGLQVCNRNKSEFHVPYPPKEDYVPYEKVESTCAAGLLQYADENNGNLVAILGGEEHPNIGVFDKVDPLFLVIDKSGNVIRKKWLKVTPNIDESNISVHRIGNNYLLMWGPGNVYDDDWAPSTQNEIAIVDANGDFILSPLKINEKYNSYSNIIPMSETKFAWFEQSHNNSSNITVYTLNFSRLAAP